MDEVIYDKTYFPAYEALSQLRKELQNNTATIEIHDFGAGSRHFNSNKREVGDIIRHGISSEKYACLLFRLCRHFNPATVLELGTSVGLTTLYLAAAQKQSAIYTIEGCPNTAAFAHNLFQRQEAANIRIINAEFDVALKNLLPQLKVIDFLYIDGNHRKTPTLKYFEQALPHLHSNSVVVFDDIHWSEEMEEAWETITRHPCVRLSLDLFFMGLVFFRTEQKQQEHFRIRF